MLFGCLFFAVWARACCIFCYLGGGVGPAQTQNKKTRHRPNSKKVNTPPTLPSLTFLQFERGGGVFCFAVWAGGVFVFFAVWAVGVFLFCCLGGACYSFCCLGGVRVVFCCLAGCRVFFCCLGGWRFLFFFLLFGRGTGVHSLTGLPGLSVRDPTTKKTKQQKKQNTGSHYSCIDPNILCSSLHFLFQYPCITSVYPKR